MKRIHSSQRLHMWPMYIAHEFRSHALLSEHDAIEISSAFLTPGIHYIKVDSIPQGREFMRTFLTTLNCYHTPAHVGLDPLDAKDFGTTSLNIYSILHERGMLEASYDAIEECIYMHIECDFLWIEATQGLMSAGWFDRVEQALFALQYDKTVPIVVLSYSNR